MQRSVEWRQADATQLPFGDGEFDVVVCQFGAMFFPDKPGAFAEARRVLRPGGVFMFNVWDRIEKNEFVHTVMGALEALYPEDPPRFMVRSPHGYFDTDTISRDLALGGFACKARFDRLAVRSRAASARSAAIGYCQANPMRAEIESHGPGSLAEATDAAEAALVRRFGTGPIEGGIQALVVSVER
jgi:SAM-dependent methyltransferase